MQNKITSEPSSDICNSSFNNVDEEIDENNEIEEAVNSEFSTPEQKSFFTDEFLAIQKYTKFDSNKSDLENIFSQKEESSKKSNLELLHTKISEYINIQKYIKTLEENHLDPSYASHYYIGIDYIENIRTQQEIMKNLLDQITVLQWEVEHGYSKIKSTEPLSENFNFFQGNNKNCISDVLCESKGISCSCRVF